MSAFPPAIVPADAPGAADLEKLRKSVRRRLLRTGHRMNAGARQQLAAAGPTAVPALIEILQDQELWLADSPGLGWAPINAAVLLCEIGTTSAIEPLLTVLAANDWDDILHGTIVVWLPKIGTAVVEPALRALAASEDPIFRESIAEVLAQSGSRDERILEILLAQLRDDPERAGLLATFGDPRALPHLSDALDRYIWVDNGEYYANDAIAELAEAIEELGGTLTPRQSAKCERLDAEHAARRARDDFDDDLESRSARARPGRNDNCWCGSKRKYKACHLAADAIEESRP